MHSCLRALGANLTIDPVTQVRAAFDALARVAGVRLLRTSSLYRAGAGRRPDNRISSTPSPNSKPIWTPTPCSMRC